MYSDDINYSYNFRGSGQSRYVGGTWAVQGLSTCGLSMGHWCVTTRPPSIWHTHDPQASNPCPVHSILHTGHYLVTLPTERGHHCLILCL